MNDQARQVLVDVFKTMEVQVLQDVMQAVKLIQSTSGSYLCREGESERTFYIIVDGEVAVAKNNANGVKELLQVKKAGDFFGEIALLKGTPRTADVYTTKDSLLLEMGLEAFRQVIRSSPQFLDNIMKLIDRYEQNHRKLQHAMIFVSYSRKDQEFAKRLIKDLKQQIKEDGIRVWFDQLDILPGKDWDESIEEALHKTTAMLLILSDNSVKSKNVKSEWHYCVEEGKVIIPIVIEKDCDIPFRLKTYHYIDLAGYANEKDYQEGLERITQTVRDVAQQNPSQ
jgi:CRP-like cAMP-binding protein